MKKILLAAAALTLLSLGLSAGGRAPQVPAKAPAAAATSSANGTTANAGAPVTPIAYQEMLNKYCITCHNQKPAYQPARLWLSMSRISRIPDRTRLSGKK